MAVLSMKQIRICALTKHRKALLEAVQRKGVVQLRDDLPQDEVFSRPDGSAASAGFERSIAAARQALEVLDKYAPEKSGLLASLEGLKSLKPGELTGAVAAQAETQKKVSEINRLAKQAAEDTAQIPRLNAQITGLSPWMELEVPLNFGGTRTTKAFIGTLPGDWTLEALLPALAVPAEAALDVTVISHSKEQTCIFALCAKQDSDTVAEALRAVGFALPPLDSKLVPAQQVEACKAAIAECEQRIAGNAAELAKFGSCRREIKLFIDYYTVRAEKYSALGELAQSKHVFFLSGYIPAKEAEGLAKLVEERFDAVVDISDPAPDADIPVVLSNNAYATPMEGILASFSLPGKGEFDPSFVVALSYYFLFGMMLSDAGYGLLLVLICGILLLKFRNMEEGMKKFLSMFLLGGVFTTFWGFMYGSFFGDAPAAISKLFGSGTLELKPIWVNPMDCPMQMLMFCLLVGVIHLFAGLGCKAALILKQKDYIGLLADVISWYLLIGGLCIFAMATPAFLSIVQLNFCLPAVFAAVGKWMAIAGAVIIVLFGGRESKNPVLRLVQGLYALYGSTSWLGDILSYSRLLALGLATGVIGQVVNQMASMGGKNPVGYVMFVLVFIVGHTLNIAINLLGAYVHTSRLQFVEFFGKFYEGGGEPFAPLAAHTKYYKFLEVK